MAKRKRSTRTGQFRKTARKAYRGLKRTTRRYRSRRGAIRISRPRRDPGFLRQGSKTALKDIGWMSAGAAGSAVYANYMPAGMWGLKPQHFFGAALGAYGIYRNDKKFIYAGFGAVMDEVKPLINNLMGY